MKNRINGLCFVAVTSFFPVVFNNNATIIIIFCIETIQKYCKVFPKTVKIQTTKVYINYTPNVYVD